MKNMHLVPQIVIDVGSKINDTSIRNNEKINYVSRIEAIRDYCNSLLNDSTNKLFMANSK